MTSKPSPKPSLTVEEDFEMFAKRNGLDSVRHSVNIARAAWQASRRRTLEEVIAKLRAKAGEFGGPSDFTEDYAVEHELTTLADELESELKAGEIPHGK